MDTQTLPHTIFTETNPAPYRESLRWLFSFATYQPKTADTYQASKLNLARMRAILGRLGNPHEKFQSVHIAGTKGKGSTAAMCESILRATGVRTGLYTSPHLHTFRERIRVGGELISEPEVVKGIARLQALQPEFPDAIVFEWITALAFDYFARAGVEFAVVEVGIGGRLDSTNVITPRVSVITSISFDHMNILGDTLAKIAREKAGIIKPGIPVVSSPQTDEAGKVIAEIAQERNAELVQVDAKLGWQTGEGRWQILPVEQNLDLQVLSLRHSTDLKSEIINLKLPLLGSHQLDNAATAIATMKTLAARGVPVSDASLRDGIQNARWQGRFEILARTPFFIVDGAHNRDSARQLVHTIDALFANTPVQWIFGASNDKDVRGMFAELVQRSGAFIMTRAPHPRACDPRELAQWALEAGGQPIAVDNIAAALALARRRMEQYNVTVVTGSLFVVAKARELFLRERGEPVESDGFDLGM